jgi:hypothetical protein
VVWRTDVTEQEWNRCTSTLDMLAFLHKPGKSDRKLRLFAAACCRRHWDVLDDPRSKRAVTVGEAYADGWADLPAMADALDFAREVERQGWSQRGTVTAAVQAATAVSNTEVPERGSRLLVTHADDRPAEEAAQAQLLRDILGPLPFRVPDAGGALGSATVVRLARLAYEERTLPSGVLDGGRLAVLADALEDAGCTESELLNHLRGPGPHVRGCWALDLVLAKG